ncbi:glycosyltransferase family 2 protein [Luteimonas sp. TWI1416]|uniref:glycosyltransferase family 2 protein n=1 Tax=unclassified Luteimonas TaxID=2629088 RepID=UPI0032095C93
MSNRPWLSVLVPFYNVEAYLRESIESVLAQDPDAIGGIEVILCDDASPDGCAAIAAELAARYPTRVAVVTHERNRGLSAARNTLLAHARGRYVWLLDSDDVILPGSLHSLRLAVDTSPDLVLCDYRLLRQNFGLRHRLRGELHRSAFSGPSRGSSGVDRDTLVTGILESRQLHVWSKIARREVWQRVHFPEGRTFEDMAVLGQLIAGVRTWTHVAQPWIGYRQRGGSIMATMEARKTRDLLASLCELHADLTSLPGGLGHEAELAIDYFNLRTFSSLARKVPKEDRVLEQDCKQALRRLFPKGPGHALAVCRLRGWWLRAARAQHSLVSRGWM